MLRHPALEELLKAISPQGLSPEEAKEKHICSICGKEVDPNKLRNGDSVKEWTISGMCQEDQDKIFGP